MAITREDLMRAGIGTGGMNPNVIPVQDMRIAGMPAQQPMMPAPQEPKQRRGLLGGFFGPEGRDTRQRLAIALEGLALNPNQALIGQLQGDIEGRATDRQKNATVAWLLSRGRDDLAAAIEGGLPAADALRIAIEPGSGAERGVVVGGNIVNPLTGEVIYQGPEVETMTPAAFTALDMQARAAGFKPQAEGGDGSYEDFMATRGSGLAAEARAIGAARGEATAAAPGELALFNTIEFQVNDLLNDPYLPNMLGPVQGRLPNVSAEAARVQGKMNQISGGAFLQARQMLKGGGAITDFESRKAEDAFLLMNTAQNEEDFRKAMQNFLDAVRAGLPKLQTAAPAAGGVATPEGLSQDDLRYLGVGGS
jgi:hypothetical protein